MLSAVAIESVSCVSCRGKSLHSAIDCLKEIRSHHVLFSHTRVIRRLAHNDWADRSTHLIRAAGPPLAIYTAGSMLSNAKDKDPTPIWGEFRDFQRLHASET